MKFDFLLNIMTFYYFEKKNTCLYEFDLKMKI